MMMAILAAAHETTANATANAFMTLLTQRDAWDALCANPALIPNAVEDGKTADDGEATEGDNVKADVENIIGGSGADQLVGTREGPARAEGAGVLADHQGGARHRPVLGLCGCTNHPRH